MNENAVRDTIPTTIELDNGFRRTQLVRDKAVEQFVRRRRYAISIEKVDVAGLHAGSPMYFYCRHCGSPTEVLPEDYIFPLFRDCSQCHGLHSEGWLEDAKRAAQEED